MPRAVRCCCRTQTSDAGGPGPTGHTAGRRLLSGDSGSMTAVRMNLLRSMFAAVTTAEPTLAMVSEPECDGAGGNLLSPRPIHPTERHPQSVYGDLRHRGVRPGGFMFNRTGQRSASQTSINTESRLGLSAWSAKAAGPPRSCGLHGVLSGILADGSAKSSFCGGYRCRRTRSSSGCVTRSGPTKGRKARSVPQFVLDELSIQCRGKRATSWCSRIATVATCPDRSLRPGGSSRCETCRGREDHAAGEWRPAIAARYR